MLNDARVASAPPPPQPHFVEPDQPPEQREVDDISLTCVSAPTRTPPAHTHTQRHIRIASSPWSGQARFCITSSPHTLPPHTRWAAASASTIPLLLLVYVFFCTITALRKTRDDVYQLANKRGSSGQHHSKPGTHEPSQFSTGVFGND